MSETTYSPIAEQIKLLKQQQRGDLTKQMIADESRERMKQLDIQQAQQAMQEKSTQDQRAQLSKLGGAKQDTLIGQVLSSVMGGGKEKQEQYKGAVGGSPTPPGPESQAPVQLEPDFIKLLREKTSDLEEIKKRLPAYAAESAASTDVLTKGANREAQLMKYLKEEGGFTEREVKQLEIERKAGAAKREEGRADTRIKLTAVQLLQAERKFKSEAAKRLHDPQIKALTESTKNLTDDSAQRVREELFKVLVNTPDAGFNDIMKRTAELQASKPSLFVSKKKDPKFIKGMPEKDFKRLTKDMTDDQIRDIFFNTSQKQSSAARQVMKREMLEAIKLSETNPEQVTREMRRKYALDRHDYVKPYRIGSPETGYRIVTPEINEAILPKSLLGKGRKKTRSAPEGHKPEDLTTMSEPSGEKEKDEFETAISGYSEAELTPSKRHSKLDDAMRSVDVISRLIVEARKHKEDITGGWGGLKAKAGGAMRKYLGMDVSDRSKKLQRRLRLLTLNLAPILSGEKRLSDTERTAIKEIVSGQEFFEDEKDLIGSMRLAMSIIKSLQGGSESDIAALKAIAGGGK